MNTPHQWTDTPHLQGCVTAIHKWLNDPVVAEEDKADIQELITNQDWTELRDRFYTEIEFGTAGLRGVMGQGLNRMNRYTVQRAIQGYANSLNQSKTPSRKTIVIAYDSRNNSEFFAKKCCEVLAANGIFSKIFPTEQTTPCLSFMIRHNQAAGGICITASHNPKNYNGLKIYNSLGAQVVPPQDKEILKEVFSIKDFSRIKSLPFETAIQERFVSNVSLQELDEYYRDMKATLDFQFEPQDLSVHYSALHGTGFAPMMKSMTHFQYQNVSSVASQEKPDGNFSTVKQPNPEDPDALQKLLQEGFEKKAELLMATDPDADRLAVAVLDDKLSQGIFTQNSQKNYVFFNGNQLGALLMNFLLGQYQDKGRLHPNLFFIKSIVTSELHRKICESYGVKLFQTLTGFKWIAALIENMKEQQPDLEHAFSTEESFGFMPNTNVRDKDGIATGILVVQMAQYYKNQRKTLAGALLDLYQKHGVWLEDLVNMQFYGEEGLEKMGQIMEWARSEKSHHLGEFTITQRVDFAEKATAQEYSLPPSNLVKLCLPQGNLFFRPSGTEPKLKVYLHLHDCNDNKSCEDRMKNLQKQSQNIRDEIEKMKEKIT